MNAPQTFDLHALRARVGGAVYDGGRRWVGPGPNHTRRDASLSVWISDTGRPIVHSFANDPFVDCARHLGIEPGEARPSDARARLQARREREAAERARREADRQFCDAVWRQTAPAAGSPVETYLARRGLDLAGVEDVRFHPEAPRSKRSAHSQPPPPPPHAAMVALVRSADGGGQALHVTYLTPDGSKAFGSRSKLMFGPTSQCAVRLAPMGSDGVLAVAEGIESARSFSALFGVPCWAALSTAGLQNFVSPAGIKRLIIAADNDDDGAGRSAAQVLAERERRRCEVLISLAPASQDWNDALRGKA